LAVGTVAQMRTSVYDNTGSQLQESRIYFLVPSSSPGTEGTHYDSIRLAYDDSGRRIRTKQASGTIRRNSYDLFDRITGASIGTNDHGLAGGESSGTSNMVTTETRTFDGGSDGLNGNLTTVARYRDGTNHDDTSFSYDYRGRRILDTPPLAPFTVYKYDTAGRQTAVGQFSSSSGLTSSSDPTSSSSNRLALSETMYDEMGRVWENLRHEISQSNGSDEDNLATLNWRDERGRVIKTDGEELKKTKSA
jgi:YD repeat-containing protein